MTTHTSPGEADLELIRATYAEVAAGLNAHADIWERDGSDPCRVRVTREIANAHRLYAEGIGEPCGAAKRARARADDLEREAGP